MPSRQAAAAFLVHSREAADKSFTIFLRYPHDITDGVGTVYLIHQLFEIASRAFEERQSFSLPEWGPEGVRLSSCLKAAANLPETLSDIQKERLVEIQKTNAAVFNHPHLLQFPPSPTSDKTKVGQRERVSLTVPKEQTAKIIAACKDVAPGVTVNHVVTVATALALAQLQPKRDTPYSARFLVLAMVNLRPYLRQPWNDPCHAVGPYSCIAGNALGVDASVSGLDPDTEKDACEKDFYQLVIEARDHFRGLKLARCDQLHEQLSFAPSGWAGWTPKPGQDVHAVGESPACNLPVSCIGDMSRVVSTNYGSFRLTNAWVASEGFGADVPVFSHTWDGQFELSSMFDNRYHTVQSVEQFLCRIVDTVSENLHLGKNNDIC